MNARIKKLWLKALRSGEYLQGKETLVYEEKGKPTEFCCLGVLTNLYVEEEGAGDIKWEFTLPQKVSKWAGVESSNPYVGKCSLAHANDAHEKSFDEIADLIEEYL